MDTWNIFTTIDILIATIGVAGIATVFIVFNSAASKTYSNEIAELLHKVTETQEDTETETNAQ